MPIPDTEPSARARQLKIHKAMSGEQRLLPAFRMSEFARELTKQGIRDQHPHRSEKRVLREMIRLVLLPAPLPPPLQ